MLGVFLTLCKEKVLFCLQSVKNENMTVIFKIESGMHFRGDFCALRII